jgi:hypothetical protein
VGLGLPPVRSRRPQLQDLRCKSCGCRIRVDAGETTCSNYDFWEEGCTAYPHCSCEEVTCCGRCQECGASSNCEDCDDSDIEGLCCGCCEGCKEFFLDPNDYCDYCEIQYDIARMCFRDDEHELSAAQRRMQEAQEELKKAEQKLQEATASYEHFKDHLKQRHS